MVEKRASSVRCPKCRREVPAHSLHCLFCGETVARLANLDGQLALTYEGGGQPRAVAVTVGGEQAKVVEEPWLAPLEYGKPASVTVKVERRGRGEEKTCEVREVLLAVQRRDEVVDVP
jgi:hypothetical protein